MSADRAWDQWLMQQGPALVLMARQWSRSHAEAEDAVQEGLLRAWKNRAQILDLNAYAFSCVRSAALDAGKSSRRRETREDAVRVENASCFVVTQAQDQGLKDDVERALKELPEDQREVVMLKIWGELTFAQIGEALAIPLNTAASKYRYGLERLRELLGGENL